MVNDELRESREEAAHRAPPDSDDARGKIDEAAWNGYRARPAYGMREANFEGEDSMAHESFETDDQLSSRPDSVESSGRDDENIEGDIGPHDLQHPRPSRSEIDKASWENADSAPATRGAAPESDGRVERIAAARKEVEAASQGSQGGEPNRDVSNAQDSTVDQPIVDGPRPYDNGPGRHLVDADIYTERGALSERDLEAIRRYTGVEYGDLNRSLWSGTVNEVEAVAPLSHDLSAALEKLPNYEGTVLRGSMPGRSAEDYHLERYEPGQTVVENGYLSCTTDPAVEFNGEVLWVIETKLGHDIEPFSGVRGEREVLIDRFSRFEVLSKETVEDLGGRWLIYMKEV